MFATWAAEAGLPAKAAYSVREVALATGVPVRTLYGEAAAGRLRTFRPAGRARGALVRPEWADAWMEEGGRAVEGAPDEKG